MLVGLALVAHGASGEAPPDDATRIARATEFLDRTAAFGFSGQVLIARGDRMLLHRAYGFADRAAGTPLTLDTPIGVASMSKAFTAATVLSLERAGALRRGAPIAGSYPGVPERWQGITLDQVLAHVSGLPGGYEDDFRARDLDEALARLLEQPPVAPPGAGWHYSSEGYNLVAAIAARAAGIEWPALLRREVFGRLGMTHTTTLDDRTAGSGAPAHAYVGWSDRGSPRAWPRNWRNLGGGDVASTAGDLHLWARALMTDPNWRSVRDTLWSLRAHLDGSAWYGYGAITDSTEWGTRRIEQAGDTELGFNGTLLLYPDEDAELIVLTNARVPDGRSMRHAVGQDLESAFVRGDTITLPPRARPLAPDERDRLAGLYDLPGVTGAVRVVDDGALTWLAAERQPSIDALLGLSAPLRAAAGRANARTTELVASLQARDTLALARALGRDGAPALAEYQSEWRGLVARHGALIGFEVLGSMPRRALVRSWARLRWVDGVTTMTWAWADSARGRLAGSDPRAPAAPLVVSLAAAPEGGILAYDLMSGRRWTLAKRPARDGASLELAPGVVARRRPGAPDFEAIAD
jgi:CubicO group peptidase (beta-lactamase class C family)